MPRWHKSEIFKIIFTDLVNAERDNYVTTFKGQLTNSSHGGRPYLVRSRVEKPPGLSV